MYKIGIKSYLSYLTEVLLFNRKRFNKYKYKHFET